MLTFNTDGMIRQSFPFPKPIMDYILENLQPQHLVKLYPTCKFFYAKYGQNIIQHLEIVANGEPESFDFTKTVVRNSNPVLKDLADFWIFDSLIDRTQAGIFPSFTKCTIKKLELNKFIVWEDFELLTKAGTIEELKIFGIITVTNNIYVDEIIAQVPNATSIEICQSRFVSTTCASLVLLNHKAKMSNLVLKNVTPAKFCNCFLFVDFVLKNSADQCYVYIDFQMVPEVNNFCRDYNAVLVEYRNSLRKAIAAELKAKEIRKKEVAALKNEGFARSFQVFARSRTTSFP